MWSGRRCPTGRRRGESRCCCLLLLLCLGRLALRWQLSLVVFSTRFSFRQNWSPSQQQQKQRQQLGRELHGRTALFGRSKKKESEVSQGLRRPLSELVPGDNVSGLVTGSNETGVFIDVGAEVEGFLARGLWMGSAPPEQQFERGQQLNATVLRATHGQLHLRFSQDLSRRCYTCFSTVPDDVSMFGPEGHCSQCLHPWRLGRGIPPFFELDGKPFHCMVGPVPTTTQEKMRQLAQKGNSFWDKWNRASSRPEQKGRLHAIGISLSSHLHFKGTGNLMEDAQEILLSMLDSPLVGMLNSSSQDKTSPLYPTYVPQALPSAESGVAVLDVDGGVLNAYVGQGYMAVRANVTDKHGPPVPVAKLLGLRSCKQTCLVCRMRGCGACEDCCVHVDNDDSASLLLGLQDESPNVDEMAFFVMGDKAFPLAGGRAFLFDGKAVPHGVWCMHGEYTGMAFVKKMPHAKKRSPGSRPS
ncbi:unnamed protein product [Polarella glacialis]|uniref:S1 motif domain-containing protein n=1 Tax=Polarella glacialis TaxID=89957 RepID=A0A813E3B3_POLGL|nr:unnamed protein product [Polarella glacialis]CAE8738211.1 unnamed protein product [Polarella glacialis]